jgi:hypothetical protein
MVYDNLGKNNSERQKEYNRLMLQEDNRISNHTLSNFFLGNKKFITEMERKFEVCNLRHRRGRPRDEEKNIKYNPSFTFKEPLFTVLL